jgi:hypothetical protein
MVASVRDCFVNKEVRIQAYLYDYKKRKRCVGVLFSVRRIVEIGRFYVTMSCVYAFMTFMCRSICP